MAWLAGLLAGLATGCSAALGLGDAVGAWQVGQQAAAVDAAEAELARYREANELGGEQVARAYDDALEALERPTLAADEAPLTAPRASDAAAAPGGLTRALEADLRSGAATRALRAAVAVGRLGLWRHAPALFAIVWQRAPFAADGPILADASTALRSVAVKHAAVAALRALTRAPR